jgi:hypothetical protein
MYKQVDDAARAAAKTEWAKQSKENAATRTLDLANEHARQTALGMQMHGVGAGGQGSSSQGLGLVEVASTLITQIDHDHTHTHAHVNAAGKAASTAADHGDAKHTTMKSNGDGSDAGAMDDAMDDAMDERSANEKAFDHSSSSISMVGGTDMTLQPTRGKGKGGKDTDNTDNGITSMVIDKAGGKSSGHSMHMNGKAKAKAKAKTSDLSDNDDEEEGDSSSNSDSDTSSLKDKGGEEYMCPSGTVIAIDKKAKTKSCEACPIGTFAEAGATHCTACPQGSFADAEGQAECEPCGVGFYGPHKYKHPSSPSWTSRESACRECPPGHACAMALTVVPTRCPQGTVASVGASVCTGCWPASLFDPRSDGTACAARPEAYAVGGALSVVGVAVVVVMGVKLANRYARWSHRRRMAKRHLNGRGDSDDDDIMSVDGQNGYYESYEDYLVADDHDPDAQVIHYGVL